MSETDPHTPQGYRHHALMEGLKMATTFLNSTHTNTYAYTISHPTLIAAPYGSNILSHIRKDSSQLTNYVLSVANYHSYAMLATTDTPVKIRLSTSITIAGSHHQQIIYIQFNLHNRSILERAYTSLFQNPLTQTMNPTTPSPQVHPTKGLTCRRSEKMAWATTLLKD
jgi:hypothetical protein